MSKVEQICNEWLKDLADDMREAIKSVLKYKGGESDLEASVKPELKVLKNGNLELTLSMNDYWYYVDKGRGATKKSEGGVVEKALNKGEWYTQKGISPAEELMKIQIEYNNKKGLDLPVRRLSYDKAKRALSFIKSRAIHKQGYPAKPFFDKVFNQARIDLLKRMLTPAIKEEFLIELK